MNGFMFLVAYALLGVATLALAIWIEVAEDGETYFWGAVFWPVLLGGLMWSVGHAFWNRQRIINEGKRARVRRSFTRTHLFRKFRFMPRVTKD